MNLTKDQTLVLCPTVKAYSLLKTVAFVGESGSERSPIHTQSTVFGHCTCIGSFGIKAVIETILLMSEETRQVLLPTNLGDEGEKVS